MGLAESIGRTAVWTSKSQQALGKDPSWTLGIRAKEPSDHDCEPNGLADAHAVHPVETEGGQGPLHRLALGIEDARLRRDQHPGAH